MGLDKCRRAHARVCARARARERVRVAEIREAARGCGWIRLSWRCRRAQPSAGDVRPNLIAAPNSEKSTSRNRKSSGDKGRDLVFIRLNRREYGCGCVCRNAASPKQLQGDRPQARQSTRWRANDGGAERKSKHKENVLCSAEAAASPKHHEAEQNVRLMVMEALQSDEVFHRGCHSLVARQEHLKGGSGATRIPETNLTLSTKWEVERMNEEPP